MKPVTDDHRMALVDKVLEEYNRASIKFPKWPYDPFHALAVIGEELGELNQAVLNRTYEGAQGTEDIRAEAIQVAAMSLRFLMALDADHYQFDEAYKG